MLRKTVTIQNDIFESLKSHQILSQYNSFSEMVSSALKLLIEKQQKEQYKKAMLQASTDELYREPHSPKSKIMEEASFVMNTR